MPEYKDILLLWIIPSGNRYDCRCDNTYLLICKKLGNLYYIKLFKEKLRENRHPSFYLEEEYTATNKFSVKAIITRISNRLGGNTYSFKDWLSFVTKLCFLRGSLTSGQMKDLSAVLGKRV